MYKNRTKTLSGSFRDKSGPTRPMKYKVNPKAIAALHKPYKLANVKAMKETGIKIYTGNFISEITKTFVRDTRKGLIR